MTSDSALFRFMELPYIKISEEDIEASVMQIKLNMPVLTSTYPNAQVWSQFSYNELPKDFGTFRYRWAHFKQYQANKWHNFMHKRDLMAIENVTKKGLNHKTDQDHMLVIG